ncbi:MAG: glycosyltransferase involved in cell wall biosynthesis [Paraglaciecola sp.]|jgi:glycosyltransferase involved in cell wall biosynthesis
MKKIAINAANLHAGGGVQVAISFIYELSKFDESDLSLLHIIVSSEVDNGLSRLNANTSVFGIYDIYDSNGVKAFFSTLNKKLKGYDVVFTIFGPNYLRVKAKYEIVGFAQLWMLSFSNPISKSMSFIERNILRIKFYIQWFFFSRANQYIVELEHVKNGLINRKGVNESKVSVVYNTVSSLYENNEKWSLIHIEKSDEEISLGLVARDYPHKNIKVLPLVGELLERDYDLKVHFYVTLNNVEWCAKDEFFKNYVTTVGSLSPEQCPSFYEQMDGVVFPSLLECFSATPLEAMAMYKPLFASDRGFVRDVCNEHAFYFDPLDAHDIAAKIAGYFEMNTDQASSLEKAKDHALSFSTAKGRAENYFQIIQQHLKG